MAQVLLRVLTVVQRVGIVVRVAVQPQLVENPEAGVDKRLYCEAESIRFCLFSDIFLKII
jgi:hypothetical protein